MENGMEVSQKNKNRTIPYDPPISFLDTYIMKMKTLIQRDIYIHSMFIATLLTVAKIQKPPNYPSMYESIKKMACYLGMKKNEIMSFKTSRIHVQGIMLPDISWTEGK